MATQDKKDDKKKDAKGSEKEAKKPLTPLETLLSSVAVLKREPLERRYVMRAVRKMSVAR